MVTSWFFPDTLLRTLWRTSSRKDGSIPPAPFSRGCIAGRSRKAVVQPNTLTLRKPPLSSSDPTEKQRANLTWPVMCSPSLDFVAWLCYHLYGASIIADTEILRIDREFHGQRNRIDRPFRKHRSNTPHHRGVPLPLLPTLYSPWRDFHTPLNSSGMEGGSVFRFSGFWTASLCMLPVVDLCSFHLFTVLFLRQFAICSCDRERLSSPPTGVDRIIPRLLRVDLHDRSQKNVLGLCILHGIGSVRGNVSPLRVLV